MKTLEQLNGSVLLVDDEPALLFTGEEVLRHIGLQVATAPDGLVGVEKFRAAPDDFDLVIMDFHMPRMNGLEAYRQIRNIRPNIPFLFVSGFCHEAVFLESHAALTSFLPKPWSVARLHGELRSLLSSARSASRTIPQLHPAAV